MYRFAIVFSLIVAGLTAPVAPAAAQDLPGYRDVKRQLYSTRGRMSELRILKEGFFSNNQVRIIGAAVRKRPFFGAIAVVPSSGIMADSAMMVFNFHTLQDAHAAALAGCNSRRTASEEACVVIADVAPKGYRQPRAVEMNTEATKAFNGDYKNAREHRAFALSAASGEWGFSGGAASVADAIAAAIAACAERAAPKGGQDCRAVSAD